MIENVRGLLSASAIRTPLEGDDDERCNPKRATPEGAVWNPTRGVWETSQPDLYGHLAPYSETWPTSGTTRAGSAYPLPPLARRIPGSASSSSPGALFRTPLASDPARGGETLDQVKARRGTIALSHQVIDLVTRRGRQPSPETLFALIEEFFDAGDATPKLSPDGNESPAGRSAPAPAILNQDAGPRAAPAFVEWLMGLDQGGHRSEYGAEPCSAAHRSRQRRPSPSGCTGAGRTRPPYDEAPSLAETVKVVISRPRGVPEQQRSPRG